MLMADKQVMSDEHFRSLSVAFYETEVNRLLVWIATATRQFLDIEHLDPHEIGGAKCGRYWARYSENDSDAVDLQFRQACNIIIHAIEIISYDRDLGYHRGIVTIRGRGRSGGRQPNRALLDFGEFAKYCVLLSREVEDHGHN